MDKAAPVRWTVLLTALAATFAAAYYPAPQDKVIQVESKLTRVAKASLNVPVATPDISASTPEADADPFAPRGWRAPSPPPPAQQSVAVSVQPVAPVVPSGPPPLPFRFVGRMNDDGQQLVYLSHGEQAVVARNGETLEGTYKVLGIDPQRIEFEHLPTGEKQVLALTANDN